MRLVPFVVVKSIVVVLTLAPAVPAAARREGNTFTLAAACLGCHSGASAPSISVEQVTPGPFVPGDSIVFHIEVTAGGDEGQKLAFAASVPAGVGTFIAGVDTEVCDNGTNRVCPGRGPGNAIRDVSLRDPVDGKYAWDIELANVRGGEHELAVGACDVNVDDDNTGDENAGTSLAFSVAEGEGEGEGEGERPDEPEPPSGGCGSSSASGVALLLGLRALRRLRSSVRGDDRDRLPL